MAERYGDEKATSKITAQNCAVLRVESDRAQVYLAAQKTLKQHKGPVP
jgi:hypothetical protein